MSKKKIGIVGGTFDPIHFGHIMLGTVAKEEFDLEEVWFMPTGQPPHKANKQVSDAIHRANMVKLGIKNYPSFQYSGIEVEREGYTYTADTLQYLSKKFPNNKYYYIVGADSLNYMDKWYQPSTIFTYATILAVPRNTQTKQELEDKREELLKQFPNGNIYLLNTSLVEISSRQLRSILSKKDNSSMEKEMLKKYLDDDVFSYIIHHHLYKEEIGKKERAFDV